MKQASFLLLLLFPFLVNSQTINTEHSYVSFIAKNMEVKKVKGTFTGMKGEVQWNENDLANSTMQACVNTNSVKTGTSKRDEHLRESDFFDAEKYPEICFTSTQIAKENKQFVVIGQLTIRNITKEIRIPFTANKHVFSGTFTINRFDFDIGKDSGTFMISEKIEITIKCLIN